MYSYSGIRWNERALSIKQYTLIYQYSVYFKQEYTAGSVALASFYTLSVYCYFINAKEKRLSKSDSSSYDRVTYVDGNFAKVLLLFIYYYQKAPCINTPYYK